MSIDLQEVFDTARNVALPPTKVDLNDAVRRGRQRRARLTMRNAATASVLGIAVMGAGVFVMGNLGHGSIGSVRPQVGGPPSAMASVATPTPSRSSSGQASAPSGPKVDPSAPPKDPALDQVRLADPAPGYPVRRNPDEVALTAGLPGTDQQLWVATFLVATDTGQGATVMVGAFPLPATQGIPTIAASPGPIIDRPTVQGRPAYVTIDGNEKILYFSSGQYTVMITGSIGASTDQLTALAGGLSGLR